MGKFIDLTGQKFGKLTVIKFAGMNKNKRSLWYCKCDCENTEEIIVLGNSLKKGNTKSCGCLKSEVTTKRNKKFNIYDLTGEYGIGYDTNGKYFHFDLEDYDKIKDYYWFINEFGYVINYANKKYIRLHKFIFNNNFNDDIVIDHINRIRNDNRKDNLRVATIQENLYNKSKSKLNKSGFIGVRWRKDRQKWYATITIKGRLIYLNQCKNKKDAIKARLEGELKYFGKDFAPQRHLFKEYNII